MYRILIFCICLVCTYTVPASAGLKMTFIYDNAPYKEGILPDWGFACLIKAGKKNILFDTGQNKDILLANAEKLGIDLKTVGTIVISHKHLDHTGGLLSILELQPKAIVYYPELSPGMEEKLLNRKIRMVKANKTMQISNGVIVTGSMGQGVLEQGMIINVPPGLIIIAGCSHPGIVEIIERAKSLLGRPVYLVIGGFHTMPATEEGMLKIVRKFQSMGVKNVGPAHCTEEFTKSFFKTAYGKNYITIGAGRTLNFRPRKK